MLPLILAGAAIGAGAGLYANEQRKSEARKQMKYLNKQQVILDKQEAAGRSMLGVKAKEAVINKNMGAREGAKQAFQASSATESVLGVSGTTGGTPFANLAIQMSENRNTLNQQNKLGNLGLQELMLGGVQQGLGYDSSQLQIDQAKDGLQDSLDYLESPLSSIMAMATGGMSGASTAMDITRMNENRNGVAQDTTSSASDSYIATQGQSLYGDYGSAPKSKAFDMNIFSTDYLPQL